LHPVSFNLFSGGGGNQLVWNILLYGFLFLIALVLLEKGADLFTDKLGELGERTGVSETTLGLLTAGMEWEELLVSLVAAFSGNIGIAVGNVIGANIANILGTFSLGPLLKPLAASKDDRYYALILGIVTTGVAALLFWRPQMGSTTGAILVGIFVLYVGALLWSLRKGMIAIHFEREEEEEEEKKTGVLKVFLMTFLGLAIILIGAELVVESGVYFASLLGVSEYVIGLTIVAIGTTVPDKVITIAGALKGKSGVVMANMIGSNIFNLLFVLGLASVVQPLVVDEATLWFDIPVMLGITWLVVVLLFKKQIGRGSGVFLLFTYAAYLAYNFLAK
jgi:cation:H+ antiporter